MALSKLVLLFQSLSLKEMAVYLPTSDKEVKKLFDYLQNLRQSTDLERYSRKDAYIATYGVAPYNDQRMRLLESRLVAQLEEVMLNQQLQETPLVQSSLRVQAYHRRNLSKSYRFAYAFFNKQLEADVQLDRHYYKYRLAHQHLDYQSKHAADRQSLPFDQVVDALDSWFIAAKLKHACEIINARNVMEVKATLRMIDQVREWADQEPFATDPAVMVYRWVYDSLTKPEDEMPFEQLSTFMRLNGHRFPLQDQREIYQYLKNYCIKKLNTGLTTFTRKLFDIYRMTLDNETLLKEEYMSPFEFKNIVTIGLRLGEHDWVSAFIPSHLKYLDPVQQKNAEVYNSGNLYFFRKEYKSTLRLFQQVEFTDVFYALDVRSIILKTYFEQGEEELFNYQAAAFRTYLSRNKEISEYQRTIYRNFIRFAAQLVKSDGDPATLAKIIADMDSVKQIADLRWLREKADKWLQAG